MSSNRESRTQQSIALEEAVCYVLLLLMNVENNQFKSEKKILYSCSVHFVLMNASCMLESGNIVIKLIYNRQISAF